MPADTLRSRTARSSLILLRENLRDLRAYSADFDPEQIDRLTKAAELTSTTIKKLLAWLEPEQMNNAAPASERLSDHESELIDVLAVTAFLSAIDRLCPTCGGLLPPGGDHQKH